MSHALATVLHRGRKAASNSKLKTKNSKLRWVALCYILPTA